MSRAELEAAAAEKYPQPKKVVGASSLGEVTYTYGPVPRSERAAYIRGRLDQAEADARIAESRVFSDEEREINPDYAPAMSAWTDAAQQIAAAIRKGVE